MKILLIATLLISFAYAEEDKKSDNIAQMKERASANIDQRIALLQAHKSCVQAASDREAMKACRKSNKEAMKKLHQENKGEREQFKEDRKAKKSN
jgi:flagellar biosynthesis regulator FlaF